MESSNLTVLSSSGSPDSWALDVINTLTISFTTQGITFTSLQFKTVKFAKETKKLPHKLHKYLSLGISFPDTGPVLTHQKRRER